MTTTDAQADAIVAAPLTGRRSRPANVALGWCAGVISVATITLALCNGEAARNWADGLAPGAMSLTLREVCGRWADVTDAMELSAPRRLVRGLWENRHAVRWPGSPPLQTPPQR